MTTNSLIQKQHEIIQRSYRTMYDYERAKTEADARFKREKETAEAAGREISSATVEEIRKLAKSTEDAIKVAKLQSKMSGGIAGFPPTATSEHELLLQISQCRSIAEQASKNIRDFLTSRADDKSFNILINGFIAFCIGSIPILLMIVLLPGLSNGASITVVFFGTAILVYILISILRRPKYRQFGIKNDYVTLIQMVPTSENIHKQLLLLAQQRSQNMLNECQTRYAATIKEMNRKLADDLNALQLVSNALVSDAGIRGMMWGDSLWRQWQPFQTTNAMAITRLGTLTTGLHKEIPTIPAFIACPGDENILFKAAGNGKNVATTAIQSIMLRLLTIQLPGKVRFTLIDPVGLGQNVATFMQLADFDEKLVTSRAWTESRHIEQQLAALSEHMENVIQKYLRGQYKTIEEYNAQAGEVAEPYRVLIVMGFPVNFSEESARRLVNIATNGPRCGVSTIIMMDTEQSLPNSFNLADLERAATVIQWEGQRFVWQDKDFEKCQLTLDTPPPLDLFNQLLKKIGEGARDASDVKVPFERIAPLREEWWKGSTRNGLKVPLGRAGATKLQYLDLGKGTAQHALVVGKTGSGKTTLLHLLITNLALFYSPDELELYLVDFKTVGFTPYAAHTLPHARVVAIQSEREFGLSVLQRLDVELERRKNIFSKAGVQDIAQYRGSQPGVRMPRILLLVDEFQEFFTQDDKVAQEATLLLDRLVRQGRAFGMHVMLGSQTLAGAYTLARTTIGQMAVRIALQCEEQTHV
jgi:ABC-type multidrug transport system fused ATPase/permease subunit